MNGDTTESRTGSATLEHIDPDTFAAFWSFVNNGDYGLAGDEIIMGVGNPCTGRRQDTEDSAYGELDRRGPTRSLTDRLTSPGHEWSEEEIDLQLEMKLKMRTVESPLEPSAAVMVEKYDFGQSRQERKQEKKVRTPISLFYCIEPLITEQLSSSGSLGRILRSRRWSLSGRRQRVMAASSDIWDQQPPQVPRKGLCICP
jgi:hypothetical protein